MAGDGHGSRTADAQRARPALGKRPPDFSAINRAALPVLETLCVRWLPGGRRVGAEWVCGSLRGEAGASMKVRLKGPRRGCWADFASDARGGDVISLAAAIYGITQTEAAERLAEMLGVEGA